MAAFQMEQVTTKIDCSPVKTSISKLVDVKVIKNRRT